MFTSTSIDDAIATVRAYLNAVMSPYTNVEIDPFESDNEEDTEEAYYTETLYSSDITETYSEIIDTRWTGVVMAGKSDTTNNNE